MKNFDEARAARRRSEDQRTFVLHDQEFVLRHGVRPEALGVLDDLGPSTPMSATLTALDALFLEMVEDRDDAHARYRAIRDDVEDPVTMEDLDEVVKWMIEQVTGRPTTSPSGSSDGREATGTSSTDDSSSPALQAA